MFFRGHWEHVVCLTLKVCTPQSYPLLRLIRFRIEADIDTIKSQVYKF